MVVHLRYAHMAHVMLQLDATVNKVLELGFHVEIGPMPGFVSKAVCLTM